MSFANRVAADMAHITREDSEFGVDIQFWASTLDPEEDDPTAEVQGLHFAQANDRREDGEGQAEMRTVIVSVTRAAVASIDSQGWMSVNGNVYVIESVHGADPATWTVKGALDEPTQHGNAARLYGG